MLLVLLSLLFSTGALSKEAPQAAAETKWEVYDTAEGDIDADGKSDKIEVLTECGQCFSWEKETPPQMLTRITLTSRSKPIETKNLTCYQCGGAKGGPILGTPVIKKKGQFSMLYQGGSRFSWSSEFKWRWQGAKELFVLIGWTTDTVDTARLDTPNAKYDEDSIGDTIKSDINAGTRQIFKTVVGKNRKPVKLKCKLKDDYLTMTFDKFNFENFDEGDKHCVE